MENEIRSKVPTTWDLTLGGIAEVQKTTKEYKDIIDSLQKSGARHTVKKLIRVQNLYSFGQMLLREQMLLFQKDIDYYKVRRYQIMHFNDIQHNKSEKVEDALRCNLDERVSGSCNFDSQLTSVQPDDVVFIVQVITAEPYLRDIKPKKINDYYIEYVVYF